MMFKNTMDAMDHNASANSERDIKANIANKMIDRDYPVAEIAKITGLSIDEVEKLK